MVSNFQQLVTNGFITEEQLDKALNTIRRSRPTIGDLAKQKKLITSKDVIRILNRQTYSPKQFGEIAIEMKILTKEQVDELIEEQEKKSMSIITALRMNGVKDKEIEAVETFFKLGVIS